MLTAYPGPIWSGEFNQLNTITNCTLMTDLKTTTLGACGQASMPSQTINQKTAHPQTAMPPSLMNWTTFMHRWNTDPAIKAVLTPDGLPLTLSTIDMCATLVNVHKAAGPDGIPGRVLRACAEQLAEVFTNIFQPLFDPSHCSQLHQNSHHCTCDKTCLCSCPQWLLPSWSYSHYFKVVLSHMKKCFSPALDPYQFTYKSYRSTEDAIASALHSALTHLDRTNTYARMLFIDFSSSFNIVIPSKLISKLIDLGIIPSLCNWTLDFLTNRPQSVRISNHTSSVLTLNTGVPQGCVLSPILFSLFKHNCIPVHGSESLIKFADDTTVVGLISGNDETPTGTRFSIYLIYQHLFDVI